VLAWVAAHVPAGFKPGDQGSQGYGPVRAPRSAKQSPPQTARRPYEWFEVFALPPVPNVLTQRWLLVEVVRGAGGQTAIRADSQVVWLPTKPPAERIPPDATVLTVTARPDVGPVAARARRADLPATVTDPARVAKVAALIDGLRVFPPRTYACPADSGGGIRLEFRAGPNGPVLALVTIDPSGCQQVSVVIDGRDEPVLWGVASLSSDVLTIAGVHWPYPPGHPYAS
jgi:hypothetical protein